MLVLSAGATRAGWTWGSRVSGEVKSFSATIYQELGHRAHWLRLYVRRFNDDVAEFARDLLDREDQV